MIGLVFAKTSLTKRLSYKRLIIVGACIPAMFQEANGFAMSSAFFTTKSTNFELRGPRRGV